MTGPDSLWPTRVSKAGKALREAGLAPRVVALASEEALEGDEATATVAATGFRAGNHKKAAPSSSSPIRVVGASQTYDDFILGFVAWVQANVAPYPEPPQELRTGARMPPLRPEYQADVDWARSLGRGAFPDVIRGRPARLSPPATDPLQNGVVAKLAPGFAFTAPGNQEKGTAWRAWEAARRLKQGKVRALGLGGGGDGDDDKGAPWLRALVSRFHDPQDL